MVGRWRDPDDVTPGARRTPREITGWRSFDPLRRMAGHPHSGITAEHIMAADHFREQVDLATLGYSGVRPMIFVAQAHLPRAGMGPAALAQTRAQRVMRRVMRLFSPPQLLMIEQVVLRNMTLRAWTHRHDPPANPVTEKRKLLVILDRLVEHFAAEVEDELARGRRLPP